MTDVVTTGRPSESNTHITKKSDSTASDEANAIETELNNESWWYYNIQESHIEKLVHEYRGTPSVVSQQPNQFNNTTDTTKILDSNMFSLLQPNESSSSMVVQFYSSNLIDCPVECRNLRDHYMKLAMHVIDILTHVPAVNDDDTYKIPNLNTNNTNDDISVKFHVINCAMHTLLCQQHQITYFPIIRLYRNDNEQSLTQTATLTSYDNKNNAVTDISYQHIHPFEVLDKLGITGYDLPDSYKDDDDDGIQYQESVAVKADLSDNETILETSNASTDGSNRDNQHSTTTAIGKSYRHRSRKELFDDMHIALDYTLRTVIFSTNKNMEHVIHIPQTMHRSDLTITEQEVLKSFLMLLQRTLPASTDDTRLRDMIKAVLDRFIYASKNHHYMDAIIDENLPVSTQYSSHACPTEHNNHPNNNDAKYTCVMWDILLMMSIGMVDFNIQSYDATEMIHPASALHTIYEYIDLFGLSTTTTAATSSTDTNMNTIQKQFRRLYNDCTFMDRCQQLRDQPKIVYEDMIDKVSKEYVARIATTYLEWKVVPLYIAAARNITLQQNVGTALQIWPPTNRCSVCWKDGSYHNDWIHEETNLYKYLKVEYGHIDAITATYRHELMHDNTMKKQRDDVKPIFDELSVVDHEVPSPPELPDIEERALPPPITKIWHNRPKSSSDTILTMRYGSICMIFLVGTIIRWLYARYNRLSPGNGAKHHSKLHHGLMDDSQRTITNHFDCDESDHYSSPSRHTMMSPRNRQILNQRHMAEQEKAKARVRLLMKSTSFQLDHLEASQGAAVETVTKTTTSESMSMPSTPPPPLHKCELGTTAIYNSSNSIDGMQQLRQRKSPLVPLAKT